MGSRICTWCFKIWDDGCKNTHYRRPSVCEECEKKHPKKEKRKLKWQELKSWKERKIDGD